VWVGGVGGEVGGRKADTHTHPDCLSLCFHYCIFDLGSKVKYAIK